MTMFEVILIIGGIYLISSDIFQKYNIIFYDFLDRTFGFISLGRKSRGLLVKGIFIFVLCFYYLGSSLDEKLLGIGWIVLGAFGLSFILDLFISTKHS